MNIADFPVTAVIALIAFALGAILSWLLMRSRAVALHGNWQRLQSERAAREAELDQHRERLFALGNERATLAGRLERLTQVETELAATRAELQRVGDARQRAEQQATALGTHLQEQQQAAQQRETLTLQAVQEREALLKHVRDEFSDKFKALANELLDEKSRKFTEQNQANLGTLLNPLREQLGEFRKRVDDVYDKESRERQLLKSEIDSLKTLNQRIDEDARNLTRALTREVKAQGAWGELVLERLLEASGLQKGRQYDTQTTFADDAGGRARPDVIVHLPEGRDIIIDAKVSLTAYDRYCNASEDAERGMQLSAHLVSLRSHVKELAERRYSDLAGINSLEFVLMFVPVEAAYIEAVHSDDELQTFALEKRVVIVTTSTLLATLQTVASLWRNDDRNRNALEIADRAGKLYDKFAGFVADIEDARNKLEAARRALGDASGKLSDGRGNLLGQVEKLRELGAKASKALPPELVERAQVDEVQARLGDNGRQGDGA